MAELDDLPVAAIVVDADRTITEANGMAERLLARSLPGTKLDELIGTQEGGEPSWAHSWHASSALPAVQRIPEREVVLRSGDGSPVRAMVAGRYLRDGAGELESVVFTARPLRVRGKHVPSGIEVVSTVSHELRSPLTSVKGYTSLLLNRWDRLPDDQKKMMLGQVHHDADRVTRLVTELLDISRLETGRLHLRRQLVDVVALARNVVEKLTLEHPELEVAIEFPEGFPRVYADQDKLEQVLTNLVENAAKYASPRGMRIDGTVAEQEVAVAVSDRGDGIPTRDLPRVFTKFFRRDHGKPTGSGLGLWISRGLVEAHGGRLTATSIEGHGSTFRFTLPTDAFERLHDG